MVSGTELQEPLQALETKFEQENSPIDLKLEFQGSQGIVNRYVDDQNDFKPTVLIPANGELLKELRDRWRTQNHSEPFYGSPRPIAKTILVGVAWSERGKQLFPQGRFQWQRLEQAMQAGNWSAIRGPGTWGSFDFVATDPTRSNSGQLTLSLWAQSELGGLDSSRLNSPVIQSLFGLVKRSVYQPPPALPISCCRSLLLAALMMLMLPPFMRVLPSTVGSNLQLPKASPTGSTTPAPRLKLPQLPLLSAGM